MSFVRRLVQIFVILVGMLLAGVEASSSFATKKTTSCGRVQLQQCWCLEENSCDDHHKSKKIDTKDDIPIINEKHILTAKYLKNHINLKSPNELNLSSKKFEAIDKNAFDNFTHLKSLNLSNNNLSKLPAFIFSKLTNLEHLDLSGNGMKTTRKLFAGLHNLEKLDITKNSMNPILKDNCFFGLEKWCEISITPKSVKKISTDIFGNQHSTSLQVLTSQRINDEALKVKKIQTRSIYNYFNEFIICIENNIVQQLAIKGSEPLKNGCQDIELNFGSFQIQDLGIIDFKKGWYNLQDKNKMPHSLSVLRITGNNMTTITKSVINDLPDYVTWLEMTNNQIERLEEGTFVHNYIFSLELNDNLITEIADNTFKMPKLYQLSMRNNRLRNTKFFGTMPASLNSIDLTDNEITEISPNSFSTLKNLGYLNLARNRITKIGNNCFYGAIKIGTIVLSDNNITTIQPGVFDNLRVGALTLDYNKISTIEKGVFNELVHVHSLSVAGNKLNKILSGSFDLSSVQRLDLSENEITQIEKGAMKQLRLLHELNLSSNPISKLENGAFFGLNKTIKCIINLDNSPVEIIQGGLFDDAS